MSKSKDTLKELAKKHSDKSAKASIKTTQKILERICKKVRYNKPGFSCTLDDDNAEEKTVLILDVVGLNVDHAGDVFGGTFLMRYPFCITTCGFVMQGDSAVLAVDE